MKANDILLSMVRGKIGKLVVKHYGRQVVITKVPDMSKVKASPLQKLQRERFRKAVAYARHINNSPELKEVYTKRIRKHSSVYQFALKEFLKMDAGT